MALQRSEILNRVSPGWLRDGARRRRIGNLMALGLAIAAPICAMLTFALMPDAGPFSGDSLTVRVLLIIDFCLAIALMGVVAWRIAALVLARRARSAGSRLHLRMVRLFTVIAVLPALLLGLFAAVTVTFGLEGWLNQRVAGVVRNSVDIAESYVWERKQIIRLDASVIAAEIARAAPFGALDQLAIARALAKVSTQRRVHEIYVINDSGEIIARAPDSYLFLYDAPTRAQFDQTREGEIFIFEDRDGAAVRALVPLPGVFDAYLYLTRPVDGDALRILARTRDMAARYEALEAQRGEIQLLFAALYLGFAVLILSAAIWFGIWFADRLARPIGRLAGAADRVAKGDLNARVHEERGDDEIATLSRAFNRMTSQVKRQRDALLDANAQIDQRRRFTEAVLSGVTAGVMSLDKEGRAELVNASAERLLHREPGTLEGQLLADQAPAFSEIVSASRHAVGGVAEGRAKITHEYGDSDLLVRVACQRRSGRIESYVVTFDDMTQLASAQRSAAWGDVARRVAHEIRNPLTPIQLSAERLRRKFGRQIETDRPVFEQCTDTIVRQVEQIRRMVEEFSDFARMPKPEFRSENLSAILREAVSLQREGHPDLTFEIAGDEAPRRLRCDRGLLSQVLTNLLKNAAEAVTARLERDAAEGVDIEPGRITARLQTEGDALRIVITDNGVGLPKRERKQLTEPYVTTRKRGTGLGLAIVKRIVEEHHGILALEDAPSGAGARVSITLPVDDAGAPDSMETINTNAEAPEAAQASKA